MKQKFQIMLLNAINESCQEKWITKNERKMVVELLQKKGILPYSEEPLDVSNREWEQFCKQVK
jgi:hypothetical protein